MKPRKFLKKINIKLIKLLQLMPDYLKIVKIDSIQM